MAFKYPMLLTLLIALIPIAFMLFKRGGDLSDYFDAAILKKLQGSQDTLSNTVRNILLLLSATMMVIALARPFIYEGEIKVKSSTIDLLVGFDISRSMFANDIYPNRLALAKKKFHTLSQELQEAKIGVIGFSSRAFLISPLTKDYATLDYLIKNMNLDSVQLRGTSFLSALEVANELMKKSDKKALLLFTDGGDETSFDKEIAYAKKHKIHLYIYNIATQKGGVIPDGGSVLHDNQGEIVVVRRNESIERLALESGGAYMNYSLKGDDITTLTEAIKHRFKAQEVEESTIIDVKELFYLPLALALLLLMISYYSLPQRREDV